MYRILLLTLVVYASADDCVPGQLVSAGDGCNHCSCSHDGIKRDCTKFECYSRKTNFPNIDISEHCKPGSLVPSDDGSNLCICSDDGKMRACTSMNCKVPIKIRDPCIPGALVPFGDGCNLCICSDKGEKGICTKMYCNFGAHPRKHDPL